ncbi:MAG: vitamin B12 dependent-methionine synthase activation domain-containing protein [Candidatus Aminicenantales bacterium]
METIDRIPVTLDPAAVAKRLRHNPARASSVNLDELLSLAGSLIRLRAVYEVSYIGAKGEDTVEVAGVTFQSRILRRNLDQAQKVFPFIVTAGPELEAAASASGDLLKQYYLEEMANIALENGAAWLAERLKTRYGLPGLASMDPGSLEDWPITEQPKLFSIFGDTERLVGVRLTDSMLMLPRKSISGIFFPSEEGFSSCQLCDRDACPARRAPYDEVMAINYKA